MKLKIVKILIISISLIPTITFAQVKVVQGTVTQVEDGMTLAGATITEVDNTNRVVTATVADINGHYVIKIKNPDNKLVFSFISYKTETMEIGNKKTIDVALEFETKNIEEVRVVGERKHSDGTIAISQREVSTAVQSISTKELEGIQVTSIDDAIQGRIPGLDIVSNSGDLGAGTSMRIRGTTSINGTKEPLIVVNGIPYETQINPDFDFGTANTEQYANMLSINPDDIEEITVLKDAASTAVWGSKGANGVLMIKTKKGVAGKTSIQYSYRLTGAVQPSGMNMLNGDDYTMLMKEAYFNSKQNEEASDVRAFAYDDTWSEYENFNNNTDWVDEVTQTGYSNDHYLTVMGGGERARFRISGGFLDRTGTTIGQELQRISSRAYLDYSVSDRLRFITEFSFTYTENEKNWVLNDWDTDNYDCYSLLAIAYKKMPNVSVYRQNTDGNNTDEYYNIPDNEEFEDLHSDQRNLRNPVALADLAENNLTSYRILPTFRLQYDLLDPEVKQLRYNMYVSFDVDNSVTSKYIPHEVSNYTWNGDLVNYSENYDTESMTVMMDNNLTWQALKNDVHNLLLYGSVQVRSGYNNNRGIGTENLPTSDPTEPYSDGYMEYIESDSFQYKSNALLFRGHYSLLGRYILGLTFRRDGSTKFGENNKYGNFPGISAKWIISDEKFMSRTGNWLSMLAIRPSWGVSGNEPKYEYLHYSRYEDYGTYMDMAATKPVSLKLSDLKWETTTSYNLGLDLGFFNDRFVFDLNYYHKTTEDLLFEDLQVSSSSGYSVLEYQNIGTMDNDGWELNFYTFEAIKISKFTWDFNFNISNYINTIVELREDVLANYNPDFGYGNGEYLSRIQEGNAYGSIYGFKYKGVYQYDEYIEGEQENAPVARDADGNVLLDENGDPMPMYFAYGKNDYEFQGGDAIYEDINNDGNIDELDIVYLGNSNPKFNGGFGSNLRYKGFGLTAFFNFRYGNKIVNYARMEAENMYYLNNQSTSVNWRWRKDGDETDMPRALYYEGYNWLGSDRYVEDGSFVRLKYLTLTYAVPTAKLKKLKLQQLSFYLTMNNLYTWTRYTGVDPEVGYGDLGVSLDKSSTPRSKDATLGVTIKL